MRMDSKGLREYVGEYRNSRGGKVPTLWKVEVFRWDNETPAEMWRAYFSTKSEEDEAFREERYGLKGAPQSFAYVREEGK